MNRLFKLCALLFLMSTTAHADFRKDLYESVHNEIQNYYSASGEWSVTKIKNVEKVEEDSVEFNLLKAEVYLQNLHTHRDMKQSCLVTFISDNDELYSINCF